ncbi:MAG: GIY-YIG nuclease family protein [Alcaligenaceae bacterium]|nr:MAG: GIY-YIG nuclease family protein [Alcaligenaceae bacterium]
MPIELLFVFVASGGFIVFAAFMLLQVLRALGVSRSPKTTAEVAQAKAAQASTFEIAIADGVIDAKDNALSSAGGSFEHIPSPVAQRIATIEEQPGIELTVHTSPKQHSPPATDGSGVGHDSPVAREIAPLSYVTNSEPRTGAMALPRSRPPIFDPEHYRRHAGMPGYLYMARNPFYFNGLYKLGYTTQTPQERLHWLNTEHREVPDVGEFNLVHAVRVPAAYDAERALFDLLAADRPVQKREFFLHSETLLKRALDATHAFTLGNAGALDEFVLWRERSRAVEPPPLSPHALVRPLSSAHGGWIYVTRSQWHRSHIYRISYTSKDPRLAVSALDSRQKRLTCRIGFHTLVHCVGVNDLRASWSVVGASLERWRVVSSKVFYEGSIEDLCRVINQGVAASRAPQMSAARSHDFGDVTVELVAGHVAPLWAAWARPCPSCGAVLRFTGTVGAHSEVECPACNCLLDCTVGASKAQVKPKK